MPVDVRKRLQPAERRARVLAAALGAFARDGYRGAAMSEIAAAAGVTKPVLYDHFPSKQALFAAVLEGVRARLLGLSSEIATQPIDPESRFRLSVESFFSFAEEHPEALRVLLLVPKGDAEAEAVSAEVQAGASAAIAAMLAPYMAGAEPVRVAATTEFLKHGVHALAEWWLDHPETPKETLVDVVMRAAWTGLGTDRPVRA